MDDFNTLADELECFNRGFNIDKWEVTALSTLEGLQKQRIHNDGLDSNLNQIGDYSSAWARIRAAAGRQTSKKDLQFNGDLIRGYGRGKNGDANVYGFFSDLQRLKAEGNQNQTDKEIFTPTDEEIDAMLEVGFEVEIDNLFKECFGNG